MSRWPDVDILAVDTIETGDSVVRIAHVDAIPYDPDQADHRPQPPARMRESQASRALLAGLVTDVLGYAAGPRPTLASRDGGQPYLADAPDIGVSLSHSDGWVAAAVRPAGLVGIDVQAPVRLTDALLRRCCSPSGAAGLGALDRPRREREFAWIWSAQEACVKANGTGLGGRPWAIPVEPGQCHGHWGDVSWTSLRGDAPVPLSVAILERPPTDRCVNCN